MNYTLCHDGPRACIAVLHLGSHPLELFSVDALNAVVLQLRLFAPVGHHPPSTEPLLVDGLTAEQRAAFAR